MSISKIFFKTIIIVSIFFAPNVYALSEAVISVLGLFGFGCMTCTVGTNALITAWHMGKTFELEKKISENIVNTENASLLHNNLNNQDENKLLAQRVANLEAMISNQKNLQTQVMN